jgi:protoporphyrinogen/coproporphyrinogen III oxidase
LRHPGSVAESPPTHRTSVAIVGGGITGLTLGYHLHQAGVPHVVLEAADRPGGVIRSAYVDGSLLEWGPQRTRLTASLRELLDQLGIADQIIQAPPGLPLFVYRAGKLRRVPFSVLDFLRSDIIPFPSKLRVLAEPFTAAANPNESVAAYFSRKLGRALYENMAGPLYGGLYASDPADMVVGLSLGHVLAEFGVRRSLVLPLLRRGGSVDPPVACSFAEGMATLPRALYSANAQNVRLGAPVQSMRAAGKSWELRTSGSIVQADRVVLTAPAAVACRLLNTARTDLGTALGRLRYNPLAVVHLRAQTDLHGLGYQVSLAERLVTRGVTYNDSLFARRGVYTAYLGGAKTPEIVKWRDDALAATAIREFQLVTGFESTALSVDREWMPAWDASWSALSTVSPPSGVHLAANWESRPGIPGRLAQAKRLAAEFAKQFSPAA